MKTDSLFYELAGDGPSIVLIHAGVADCRQWNNEFARLSTTHRTLGYDQRGFGAEQRLTLASNGNVIVGLQTPYDDGTTHVVLSPLEFIGRLAALVPRPRVNLTRFHGVFSRGGLPPNSKLRNHVVPQQPTEQDERQTPRAYAMD